MFCGILLSAYGQQTYPKEVQDVLDRLEYEAREKLMHYRWNNSGWFCFELMYEFQFPDSLARKAENYNLNVGMLYDEDMRNRIVKLLKGEIEPYEMDTITTLCYQNNYSYLEKQIFQKSKIDTMQIFRTAIKKQYTDLERENKVDYDKKINYRYEFELFKQMQLDTISEYQKLYFNTIEGYREDCKKDLLDYYYNRFDYSEIAKLSGYIDDERFVKPLIAALNKPKNFKQEVVMEALARMKIEPYYSQYFKERTRSLDEIKKERPNFRVEELVEVIRTQESFRELSKYLLSEAPYGVDMSELGSVAYPIYGDAYYLIKDNIENEELQDMMPGYTLHKDENVRKKVYDWMQKNYGKYEIKRVW